MPTKRAILAELPRDELRTKLDHYELEVEDRRVNAQLVDALVHSRRASLDEILQGLSLDRLKELCRAFDRDDSGRKADLAARLMGRTAASPDKPIRRQRPVSTPPTPTPQPALSVRQPWAWALLYGGKTVENRTWARRARGRIWIHASSGRESRDAVEKAVSLVAQGGKCNDREALEHYREHNQRGAILGSMTLTDCHRLDELDRSDPLRSNPWAYGPWLWLVTDPEPCDLWPTPGRPLLWMAPSPGRDH